MEVAHYMGGKVDWVLDLPVPSFNSLADTYRRIRSREIHVASRALQAAVGGLLGSDGKDVLGEFLKAFPLEEGGSKPTNDQDAFLTRYQGGI